MIYLDHAATSYPKPDTVASACQHWLENVGVSAERGDGPHSQAALECVTRARREIALLTGHDADHVGFCSGATEGLNLTLRALLKTGDRVLTTAFEHSSVVRPLTALRDTRKLQVDVVSPSSEGIDEQICQTIKAQSPAVVIFTHASNVTGAVLDAKRICDVAREHGATTVLDACQTAGNLSLQVGADIVISSCHKALLSPPGIGFVSLRKGMQLPSEKQGGTGSSMALADHPTEWPQAFEAGTPNTLAIFGLAAALEWIKKVGPVNILQRSLDRLTDIAEGLTELKNIQVFEPHSLQRTPVLSFVHSAYDPAEIGSILASNDIHVRTGFHCAPWIHQELGTQEAGTVRVSTGYETTKEDVAALLGILRGL
jgi:cysteine desulfurase / selenocysteine lyase